MADEIVTRQQLLDAGLDAESLQKFISGTEFEDVLTRLGMQYPTLAKAVLLIHQLGESKIDDVLNDLKIRYLALSVRGNWTANTAYEIKYLVFVNNITYICLVDHTSSSNFQDDLNSGKWIIYQGVTQVDLQSFVAQTRDYPPVLGSPVRFRLNPVKASMLYGLNDPTHLDDDLNNFRGLNNPNAWHDSNIPIGAVAFGRNNVPFAYLSMALGHDCVAYGVASFVGGAGTATGNPDVPSDGAAYGYCSIAWGKNSVASGRISHAFGERVFAQAIHSEATGHFSYASPSSAEHPNTNGGAGLENDGNSAMAKGYNCFAYGVASIAFGRNVISYNNSKTIGSGIDDAWPLINALPESLAFGVGTRIPTIIMDKSDGSEFGFGKLGINTIKPLERIDINLKDTDNIAVTIPVNSSANIDFRGLLGDNNAASIFRMTFTNPNAGQPYGTTTLYQNNRKVLTITEEGVFKLTGRVARISPLASNAPTIDIITAINKLISALTDDLELISKS
ncbi:hypothetical protein MMY88_17160 [Acinetobacter baumannii]|uniref:hypothetical protein n=1 Tax=Acinetobacter baumannii TaxID=470 RepID=UPI0023017148|nr:hypothetical protein [Acinetobacter baumannii]MDA5696085.1 hypothetical protein [Acinetobacter baumannii]